jgi:hypothetical protein
MDHQWLQDHNLEANFSDIITHGEVSTGKPVSKVGRVCIEWWTTSKWCAIQNEIKREITKCKWNKTAFNVHPSCNNKLKIKIKFHCFIYFRKSSGSFAASSIYVQSEMAPGFQTVQLVIKLSLQITTSNRFMKDICKWTYWMVGF